MNSEEQKYYNIGRDIADWYNWFEEDEKINGIDAVEIIQDTVAENSMWFPENGIDDMISRRGLDPDIKLWIRS